MTKQDEEEREKIQIIKELNIVFKERGWKPLPEDNGKNFADKCTYGKYWVKVIRNCGSLNIDRSYIPYYKHINSFTVKELDYYVIEHIKPYCEKYKIEEVFFGGEMCGGKNEVNRYGVICTKSMDYYII